MRASAAQAKTIQIESLLDPTAGHILGDANRAAGNLEFIV